MAKYIVDSYYQVVCTTIIEADSPEEAMEKGFKENELKQLSECEYVGYMNTEVKTPQYEVLLTDENNSTGE